MEELTMKRSTANQKPKATKEIHFHVPAPQRERIMKKFISGEGIRKISREEHRSRGTVSRIVNSTQVQSYVEGLRAEYYGLGTEAMEALRRALRKCTDGKIAYQLLADIGVVPDQQDRQRLNITPLAASDEEAQVQVIMGKMIQCAAYRAASYGRSLGEMEKDLEAAGGRVNYDTGGIEAADTKPLCTPTPISKKLHARPRRRTKGAA
jgi:hypothetical protein